MQGLEEAHCGTCHITVTYPDISSLYDDCTTGELHTGDGVADANFYFLSER
jgi:hypothetical protein